MAKLLRKFALLMWKNWLVLKRHPWVLIGEIIYVLSVLVLIYLLRREYSVSEQETYYGYPQELDWRSFTSSGCASGDSKQIAYSPTSPLLHRMMVSSCTRKNLTILEFDTKAELSEKISTDNQFVAGLNVALEFSDNLRGINESKDVPDDVEVTIRLPHKIDISDKWYSDRLYSYVSNMWGSSGQYAYERKFLRLQSYIMFFLAHDVDYIENFPTDNTIVSVSFPRPAILYDEFFGEENLSEPTFIALIICLFVYNHLVTIKKVASEKEKQLKESMKIMGLPGWLQWLCWFLQALLFNTVYIVLLLCMYTYIDPPIFVYSNGCILFLFFFLYAFSLISLAFLISTLFAKANANVLIGCFILLIAIFAYYSMVNRPEEKGASAPIVLLTSLLPTSALGFGMQIIFIYERIQKGVNWHNVATKPIPLDVSLRDIMVMLLADAILYMCLALYIEIVFPGEYGVPQPWYFLCLRSTWTSKPTYLRRRQVEQSATSNRESFEQVAGNRPVGIQLVNLTKTFGSHQAIKNLNLELYQGQLTVLVGHNGAGKTTTLNAITGMLPPSGGTVYVNGYDVRKNITKVRDGMGLCLEHNVLFDELTVTEHLRFFSKLKGLDGKEAVSDVDKYVKALQLEEKRNSYPRTLSGGMKRKVSVAAALCGRTKVVILDEPTKGMDPSSRREVWNLLQEIKGDRTILLTTHYMDEADVLGDRVAIMATGEVRCCGSSFFLKQKYGAGYYLVLEVSPRCQPDRITALVKKHIANAQLHSSATLELSYHLPGNESQKFEAMLSELENNLGKLEIISFGVSVASLEDVFMKVIINTENKKTSSNGKTQTELNDRAKTELLSGFPLIANQIIAMFLKRSLSTLRWWPITLIQIFLPGIVFLLIMQTGGSTRNQESDWPLINVTNLDLYPSPITLLAGERFLPVYRIYKGVLNSHQVIEVDRIENEILRQSELSRDTVKMHYIIGASFNSTTSVAWFNSDAIHALPLSLGLVLNALYREFLGSDRSSISFVNHPLPRTMIKDDDDDLGRIEEQKAVGVILCLGYAVAFVASLFILFYINERSSGSKNLQMVSGVNVFVFWITSFLCDLIVFFLMLCVIVALILILEFDYLKSYLGCLIVLFIAFFCFVLMLIYLLSIMLKKPSYGLILLFVFGFITGSGIVLFLNLRHRENRQTAHSMLVLTPFGSLTLGMFALFEQHMNKQFCSRSYGENSCEKDETCCYTDNCYGTTVENIGTNIICSFIISILCFILLIMHEYSLLAYPINRIRGKRNPPATPADVNGDVQEEINRIKNTPENTLYNTHSLVLRDLTKYYGKFPSVKGLCLAVKSGECFGLIGENGAGKTTTFKMITGETSISYGDAVINGLSVRRSRKTVQKQIGYCPQFDALPAYLTPRETIRIFALLRGVTWKNCKPLVENLAEAFDFSKYVDNKIKTLSGGNKRKVSAALAVVGDPPLVYLDELSSGVDPVAKRRLRSTLLKHRNEGKCIIMTTQSIEETEALCTRVAIMVNGSFQCLGSIQRLKSQFAMGCSLKIKAKKPVHEDTITAVDNFVKQNFPKAVLLERYQEMLSYEIEGSMAWSKMFGVMERNKKALGIEEYTLEQASLEQVFLNFVKHQE